MRRELLPAALLIAAACGGSDGGDATGPAVAPGESIQAALAAAQPGDSVRVAPGVYREALTIDRPGITLIGVAGPAGSAVVLENPGGAQNGITATDAADGVEVRNLTVRGFDGNGVLLAGVEGFVLGDLVAEDNGEYGLYPVQSSDGVVERSVAAGHRDAGIYVGQSRRVAIRDSRATGNVIGFEIENSSDVDATGNEAADNTAGFLVVLLPGLPVTEAARITLAGNRVRENDRPNFASGGIAAAVPPGSGILVVGTDATTVRENAVTGNGYLGIGVASTEVLGALAGVPVSGIDPAPDGVRVEGNTVRDNGGAQPVPVLPPGTDLLWDGTGGGNCWGGNVFDTSLRLDPAGGPPDPALPACS